MLLCRRRASTHLALRLGSGPRPAPFRSSGARALRGSYRLPRLLHLSSCQRNGRRPSVGSERRRPPSRSLSDPQGQHVASVTGPLVASVHETESLQSAFHSFVPKSSQTAAPRARSEAPGRWHAKSRVPDALSSPRCSPARASLGVAQHHSASLSSPCNVGGQA